MSGLRLGALDLNFWVGGSRAWGILEGFLMRIVG